MSGPPATIAVAVVVTGGRVLVGRRAADAVDAPGLHEFPGGKVEAGETPAAAAVRECLEEAGLSVQVGPVIEEAAGGPRDASRIVFFWARPVDDGAEPRPPFAWQPLDRLPSLRFPAANDRVLAALVSGAAADHQGGS